MRYDTTNELLLGHVHIRIFPNQELSHGVAKCEQEDSVHRGTFLLKKVVYGWLTKAYTVASPFSVSAFSLPRRRDARRMWVLLTCAVLTNPKKKGYVGRWALLDRMVASRRTLGYRGQAPCSSRTRTILACTYPYSSHTHTHLVGKCDESELRGRWQRLQRCQQRRLDQFKKVFVRVHVHQRDGARRRRGVAHLHTLTSADADLKARGGCQSPVMQHRERANQRATLADTREVPKSVAWKQGYRLGRLTPNWNAPQSAGADQCSREAHISRFE